MVRAAVIPQLNLLQTDAFRRSAVRRTLFRILWHE